jgi:tetratricopeptide (TPR) repeat protein
MAMTAQFENANVLRYQGKLKESLRMFERTHQMSDAQVPERKLKSLPVGFAYLQQALIHLEWNDLEQGLHLAREGIRLCKLWGYSDYLYNGWFIYAQILYETGDLDGAMAAIGEAKQIFRETSPGNRISALEAVINQARGDWMSADAWLSSCSTSTADPSDFEHDFVYFLFARILEGQGKLEYLKACGMLWKKLGQTTCY